MEPNTMTEPGSSRQEFERELLARAASDEAFRHALVADPRQALKEAYGLDLPPDLEVEVLQETGTKVYIVLPAPTHELTEEELSGVAGGMMKSTGIIRPAADLARR